MNRYKRGDYKVRCDYTGSIVKASECRMMWNGLFVLKDWWEPRHPQDHVKSITENKVPAYPRPEGTESFIDATDVTADDL